MASFDPRFWEILTDPDTLDQFPCETHLWYAAEEDPEQRERWLAERETVLETIREIIDTCLTTKQQECVLLYFYQQRTQQEIAKILGISRRVVSQHLFGIRRNGKQVGGAVHRIQKICQKRGIRLPTSAGRSMHTDDSRWGWNRSG